MPSFPESEIEGLLAGLPLEDREKVLSEIRRLESLTPEELAAEWQKLIDAAREHYARGYFSSRADASASARAQADASRGELDTRAALNRAMHAGAC
jgi:hypothetical protein